MVLYNLFRTLKNSCFHFVLYHQCYLNPSSEASPLVLSSADPTLWAAKRLHSRSSQMSAVLTRRWLCPLLLRGGKVTCKMCWSHLISPCIPQPPAGLSLERSQSDAPKLAMVCASLLRLATKLVLEENFFLFSKYLNNWRFGCKSTNCTQFTGVFFISHSLAFFPPIGTGIIYSRGGPSLQLINLSLACGLKRDTMPLSKARLAQKPMQNHHQILLEVENIS